MRKRSRNGGAVVLLSGGMDSATTLAIARSRSPWVDALTFDYGQRHAKELGFARRLARHFRVRRHSVVQLPIRQLLASPLTDRRARIPTSPTKGSIAATYVPARNTILLALALGYAESVRADAIYLGINAVDYSGYPDCRPEFLRAFQRLSRLATRRGVEEKVAIRIEAPLIQWTKAQIVRRGGELGVPWAWTWSCYRGGRRPCGRCPSCRIRAAGFREARVADPLLLPR